MRINIRIDQSNFGHVHVSVFVNRGLSGRLCMNHPELIAFVMMLFNGRLKGTDEIEVTGREAYKPRHPDELRPWEAMEAIENRENSHGQ